MKTSTAFILIILSVGLFYTFTDVEYKKAQLLQAEASQYRNILDNVSDLIARRDDLLVQYRNIPQAQVDELMKILPDNVDVVRLSMDLDSIGSKYGISIRSIRAVQETAEDTSGIIATPDQSPYGKSTISFSFISSYDSFQRFLQDIESSLRISNIRSVSFQSADNGLYQYQIAMEVYWLK